MGLVDVRAFKGGKLDKQFTEWREPSEALTTRIARNVRRLKFGKPSRKVFCVGFQKTGTTSLGYALHRLGYRVAGSTQIDRNRALEEILEDALSRSDSYDAFQDMPWCLFFREMNRRWPNSKFILTLRDPEDWYQSLHNHFKHEGLSRLQRQVYDTRDISNKAKLISVYERHINEVRSYFSYSPDLLLELSVGKENNWISLCEFLGIANPPAGGFPRLNSRKR